MMERPFPMQFRLLFHAATLLLVLATCGLARAQSALESERSAGERAGNSTRPRITECRVGFASRYKVGFWTPVWVDLVNVAGSNQLSIEVAVVDSDGVETTIVTPVNEAAGSEFASMLLYAKIGRTDAPIRVSLVSDGTAIDRETLDPRSSSRGAPVLDALPATSELVLSFGGGSGGLRESLADRDTADGEIARRVVEMEDVARLPDEWFGYEAVDVFVISGSDLELCRALAADGERLAALQRWVELGGQLVIVCGGSQAEELFAESEPLAALFPGTFSETVRLSETIALEHFAEAPEPIAGRHGERTELAVPKLENVRGNIEVYAGRMPTDLPIVVRAPLGLGEVTFAGLDLAAPPLAEWPGRTALWQTLLRPYVEAGRNVDGPKTLGTLGYNDLSGALRQRLGRAFPAVTTVTFPVVALLVIVYLVLLGPAHYWLVHHFGGRPTLAWVVFPLLVLVTSCIAYWIGQRSKGGAPRVNQVELVDFGMTTRQVRGTYWAALYSPESRRFDIGLRVHAPNGVQLASPAKLVSWWGLPGVGVGGMHAGTLNLAAIDVGYRLPPSLDAMQGVPVLTSSTKSVVARWTAPVDEVVRAELSDDDGMLVGSVANHTGETLHDARLLYGMWAYRLGDLRPSQQIDIGEHLSPLTVSTLVTRDARTGSASSGSNGDRALFFADRASTDKLLTVMMFYRAAGGEQFAQLPNRYQSYCDLSRLLDLGRAILVADVEATASQLVDTSSGEPLGGNAGQRHTVYRFVLPVEK